MMLFSILGLVLFLYLLPKRSLFYSTLGLFLILIIGSACSVYFVSDYFTGRGFDQSTVYHLFYGIEGAGVESDKVIMYEGVGILILTILVALSYFFWSLKTRVSHVSNRWFLCVCVLFALLVHPLTWNLYDLYLKPLHVELIEDVGELPQQYAFSGTSFEENYINNPQITTTQKKKNLLYIYLESYEQLYLDEDIFPGVAPNLNSLREQSTVFTNIQQVFGTNWTIAGMVGSQCGIPLIGSGEHTKGRFLKKANCAGDILKEYGYNLSYIGGSDLKFAQKGAFYTSHKFDTVLGKDELMGDLENPEYQHDWGLYDDSLFERLYKEFVFLAQKDAPFAMLTLNLDTHGDEGMLSKPCKDIDDWQEYSILNAYSCTDILLADFIEKIRKSPYYKDTTIVIASDHYAMNHNNSVSLLQKREDERRNIFMILDEDLPAKSYSRTGSTLDIAPTILTTLGIETQAVGLGRNLFNVEIKNLSESYAQPDSILSSWREELKQLW